MDLTPNLIVLWLGVLVGAITDVQQGLIKNWLTFSLMAFGIVYHALVGPDRWFGLTGCATAFALHFVLYLLTIQKAGDAKLFMAIGACAGTREMLETSVWFAILYLPVGLLTLAVRGRLSNLIATIRWSIQSAMGHPAAGEQPEPTMMIAGPTILVATLLAGSTDAVKGLLFG
ncbi:MAG: A24 family peptidase [Myxococcota bacterium]